VDGSCPAFWAGLLIGLVSVFLSLAVGEKEVHVKQG
jgi:hypothetical protein